MSIQRSILASVVAALATTGCLVDLSVPEAAYITCRTDADCPGQDEYRCVDTGERALCLPRSIDDTPPAVAGTPTISRPRASHGVAVEVSFAVATVLATAPTVAWIAPTARRGLTLESVVDQRYVYTFTPDRDEDPAGAVDLKIELIGDNGLESTVTYPAMLVLDFVPPALVPSTVALRLTPGLDNPLRTDPVRTASAATQGTDVRLFFALDEALSTNPVVRLQADPTVELSLLEVVGNFYTFTLAVDGAVPEGATHIEILATDTAGSTTDPPLLIADGTGPVVLTIDRTPPAVPDVNTPGAVTYTRAPWGQTSVPRPTFCVSGAPAAADPGVTIIAYDAEDSAVGLEIGRTDAAADGSFGGDFGTESAFELNPADRRVVYLVAVDGAGNASDVNAEPIDGIQGTAVRDIVWIASLGRKFVGSTLENPHHFETRARLDPYRYAGDSATTQEVGGELLAQAQDGLTVTTAGAGSWRQVDYGGNWPNPATDKYLLSDPVRANLVLLEMSSSSEQSTRVYQAGGFKSATSSAPPYRDGLAVGFDPSRGRAVLFGGGLEGGCGYDSLMMCGDTWEWDGFVWQRVATTGPAPRGYAAMAYDSTRDAMLLFGGVDMGLDDGGQLVVTHYNDTWAWSGLAWTQVASDGPPARFAHAMAEDARNGRVFLHGGQLFTGSCNLAGDSFCSDTWTWDGVAWQPTPSIAAPGARSHPGLAFDVHRGKLVLFGGQYKPPTAGAPCLDGSAKLDGACYYADTWELGTTGWSQRLVSGPRSRYRPGLVFDADSGEMALFGGLVDRFGDCGASYNSRCNDLWMWDGTRWVQKLSTAPWQATDGAAAYDEQQQTLLFYGGFNSADCPGTSICGTTWTRDVSGWSSAILSGPTPRYKHSLAYDAGLHEVLMFGGEGNGPCDGGDMLCVNTWAWDATGWHQRATTGPEGRNGTALAYDSDRGVVVLFGGTPDGRVADCEGTGALCGWTWEWNRVSWSRVCTTSPCSDNMPSPRRLNAMAYDPERHATVLFGGACSTASNTYCDDDTWLWNGTAWSQVCDTPACRAVSPSGRVEHAMTYDPERKAVLLTGGNRGSAGGCYENQGWQCTHTWEWDGQRWSIAATEGPIFDRERYTAAFDAAAHRTTVVGPDTVLETWDWRSGALDAPAHVASFSFAASGEHVANVEPVSISVRWDGGGTGYSASGAAAPGVQVQGWQRAAWIPLATGSANVDVVASTQWSTTTDADWQGLDPAAFAANFRLLFAGRAETLDLALAPLAASGPGSASQPDRRYAEVATDYVEVAVGYRR